MQRHQPRRLHVRRRVRDPVLHGLVLAEDLAVGDPVGGTLTEHVERAPGHAQPAHAVMDAPRVEALLGDQESLAFAAQAVGCRDPHVVVDDLRVTAELAELLLRVLHGRHVAQDVHAGRIGRHDEHRRALVRPRLGVGDGHHDQEVRDRAVRGEPLVPGDHVVVAVAHRARLQLRRVAAGGLGLGHREGGFEVAREQRLEPVFLLLGRAGQGEDLRVARVRRLAAERIGCKRRGTQDLVHQPQLHLAEPLPPSSGSRCAAHRPRSRTCSWSGA